LEDSEFNKWGLMKFNFAASRNPEIHPNFRVKLHNLSFLRRCLVLDEGFKLECSVDLKKGKGEGKN